MKIKRFLEVFTLLFVSTSVFCGYVPPQSTNQNPYPNVGNTIYRDYDPFNLIHVGHAALLDSISNYGNCRRVIEARGPGKVSGIDDWTVFCSDMSNYWGAYTQERMNSQGEMDTVFGENLLHIAETKCLNVPYGFFEYAYKYGDPPIQLRCDGLVEYCYEKMWGEYSNSDNSNNSGIVPGDYYNDWMYVLGGLAKYECDVHKPWWWIGPYYHNMAPIAQMEWINDGYNDGHDWGVGNPRKGRNSVPNIVLLDTNLVFGFSGKKGEYKENELLTSLKKNDGFKVRGSFLEKAWKSGQINKILSLARPIISNEQKSPMSEKLNSNSKGYETLFPLSQHNKNYVTLCNTLKPLSKKSLPSVPTRSKVEAKPIFTRDKNKLLPLVQDRKSSKGQDVILGPESFEGSATGWTIFPGEENGSSNAWYIKSSGIPDSEYCDGTHVAWIDYDINNVVDQVLQTPTMNFSCFTGCSLSFYLWQSSDYEDSLYIGVSSEGGANGTWMWRWYYYQTGYTWNQVAIDLSDYDGQPNVVVGFRYYAPYPENCAFEGIDYVTVTGNYTGSGDTTQNLRIANDGLAPLKVNLSPSVTWIKEINPCSLFIFPGKTETTQVTASKGNFTTSQPGNIFAWHNSINGWDYVPINVRLEIGGVPVKDIIPPLICIYLPDSGTLWKTTDDSDIILFSMNDNNNLITHLKIDCSTDSGATWNYSFYDSGVICHNLLYYIPVGELATLQIPIPNVFSKNCLVRISAIDFSGNCGTIISNPFTISNDTTSPPAPISLTANGLNPSPWQDSVRFIINWTNPYDISGIAGTWCKLDTVPPSYSGDGFYIDISEKPCTLYVDTFIKTPRNLYVWLQDSSGNKDDSNRAFVELRYDAASPAKPESLLANGSNPSPSTTDSIFTIRYIESDSLTKKSSKLRVKSLELAKTEFLHSKNKGDASGIALALYKLGTQPVSNYDTTRTANTNPFNVICTTTGGETLWVWLKDHVGNLDYNNRTYVILNYQETGIEDKVPDKFVLFSPSPNPSLQNIAIKYGLPEKAKVSLSLYDVSGRLVKNLCSDIKEKGYYTANIGDGELREGIYFIKFSAGNFKVTRKLTILK